MGDEEVEGREERRGGSGGEICEGEGGGEGEAKGST